MLCLVSAIRLAKELSDHNFARAGNATCCLRFENRGQYHFHAARRGHELDAQELALADANGTSLLRDRAHGDSRVAFRHFTLRRGSDAFFPAAMRRHDCGGHGDIQNGAGG